MHVDVSLFTTLSNSKRVFINCLGVAVMLVTYIVLIVMLISDILKTLFMTTEMLHTFPRLMIVKLIQCCRISTVVVVVVVDFRNFLLQCL